MIDEQVLPPLSSQLRCVFSQTATDGAGTTTWGDMKGSIREF